jgi:two-component system sensor histidine kinase TctE
MKRVASLRTALLYPLLWLWVIPAVVATLAAFWFAGEAAETSFDRVLKDDALALAAQVHWDQGEPRFKADSATAASLVFDSLSPSRFVVRTESGKTLTGNADLAPPSGRAMTDASRGGPVFFDVTTSWGMLRSVALRLEHDGSPERVWIIVGEAKAKRDQISHELAAAIFLPAAVVGFLIVPLLFFGIRHGLAPAREISDAVAQRSIEDLSPLPLESTPDELRGLVVRINELLARLAEAIAHERHFIAEAAHQLRTPAAGIKLLAEDLLKTHVQQPGRPPDTEVLHELVAAAGRASHVVQQLLAMARADLPAASQQTAEVELVDLVKSTCLRWMKVALSAHKNLRMSDELKASRPHHLRIQPTLFEEALGNVIENAILYGGTTITLDLEEAGQDVLVHVSDDGVALEPEAASRIFMPFWRGADAGADGSGLGLAIAQKALRNMGGDLLFGSGPGIRGNRFTFRLPLKADLSEIS